MAPVAETAQDHGGGGKNPNRAVGWQQRVPRTDWIAAFKDDVWGIVKAPPAEYAKSETGK
jgi:branched-chain amino acid transport system substrate-binding protein